MGVWYRPTARRASELCRRPGAVAAAANADTAAVVVAAASTTTTTAVEGASEEEQQLVAIKNKQAERDIPRHSNIKGGWAGSARVEDRPLCCTTLTPTRPNFRWWMDLLRAQELLQRKAQILLSRCGGRFSGGSRAMMHSAKSA
jgi:hypothetical protein